MMKFSKNHPFISLALICCTIIGAMTVGFILLRIIWLIVASKAFWMIIIGVVLTKIYTKNNSKGDTK